MEELTVAYLAPKKVDYVTAVLKGGFGAVPFGGGALAEAIGGIIPHQRMDRLVDFARQLSEHLSEIERTLALPVIQALLTAPNDPDLCGMFAKLLAAAMDRDTAYRARPAFVEVLKQITPDEAWFFKYLASNSNSLRIYLLYVVGVGLEDKDRQELIRDLWPAALWAGCAHLDLVPSYLDNFVRLGLISRPTGRVNDQMRFMLSHFGLTTNPMKEEVADLSWSLPVLRKAWANIYSGGEGGTRPIDEDQIVELESVLKGFPEVLAEVKSKWSSPDYEYAIQATGNGLMLGWQHASWTNLGRQFIDVCVVGNQSGNTTI